MLKSTKRILVVLTVIISFSFVPRKNNIAARSVSAVKAARTAHSFSSSLAQACDLLYDSLQLGRAGLSEAALEYAMKGYTYLQEKGQVSKNILSICDFSQPSRNKRLYIIDMESRKLLYNTYVAHGKNSGAEFATSFSNSANHSKAAWGFTSPRILT